MNNAVKNTFKGWKIYLAMFIGLSISGWLFYRSLTEVHFVKVKSGKGEYTWVDGNHNDQLDKHDISDFKADPKGEYILQDASHAFKQVDWNTYSVLWIIAAVLFTVGRDFFYMVRIRILTNYRLTWKSAFYVIMLWEFASALTPGVVGGAAVAMFILNRENIPFGKATAIVIITAFMDNLFYVVMIPLVLIFVRQSDLFLLGDETSIFLSSWFYIGFTIILSICILLYLTIFWYPRLATRILINIFRLPFLRRWKIIAYEWGKDIETASKQFREEKRLYWWKVFGATMASWTSRFLVINAILNAFLSLGFIDNIRILGKQLIMWLFMLVSPTPGGSGVAEFAFSELLGDLTTSAFLLGALALLWRLISYFPYLFIGLFLFPSWIRSRS